MGALLMTGAEASAYVGLAEAELLSLRERGDLPSVLVGERLLFRKGDLAALGRRLRSKAGRRGR